MKSIEPVSLGALLRIYSHLLNIINWKINQSANKPKSLWKILTHGIRNQFWDHATKIAFMLRSFDQVKGTPYSRLETPRVIIEYFDRTGLRI